MIQPPYTTGTATVTAGSAVVTGTTTAWALGLVNGGMFSRLGLSIPIVSVQSDTSLTLAYPWPGASGTGAYAIDLGRADAASSIVANRRLLEYLSGVAAMSPLGAQIMAATTEEQVRDLILSALGSDIGGAADAAAVRTLIEALGLAGGTLTGQLILPAGTTARAPLRLPPGVAPTTPVNGDVWATAAALLARINGVTRTLYDSSNLPLPTQAQAEAGAVATAMAWSPQRDAQAIAALEGKGTTLQGNQGVTSVGTTLTALASADWTPTVSNAAVHGQANISVEGSTSVFVFMRVQLYLVSSGALFYTGPELALLHAANGLDRHIVPFSFTGLTKGALYRARAFAYTPSGSVSTTSVILGIGT